MGRQNLAAPHRKAADQINRLHNYAKEMAQGAVEHAIECGKLLAQVKSELPRGDFDPWVEKHCEFGRSSAYNYMRVARDTANTAVQFASLRQALGYEKKPKAREEIVQPLDDSDTPKGAVPVVKAPEATPEATGETGADRPAAPATPPTADAAGVPAGRGASSGELVDDEPPYSAPEADEDALIAAIEREQAEALDKAMQSDDRLAAALAEVKRQAAEIAALKLSRDGYQGRAAELVRLLRAEQNKTGRLSKRLDAATAELEKLRERIAVMEAA